MKQIITLDGNFLAATEEQKNTTKSEKNTKMQ